MKRCAGFPALALAACAAIAASGAPALAQYFGQNKITYETFKWKVYKAPHFDVHHYEGMEPFLEEIVSYAESAYLKISRELDHELRFRVQLVVYKTHGEFQQTNITLSTLGEGVGAFAEPIQNRMVLPIDMPPDKLYQLIAHELTHIFEYSIFYDGYIGRALRSNPPTWLMEGLASYLADDEDDLDRMAIRDGVVNNILPPIEALNVVTFLTYRYGHAIFDFIEQEHGTEGLRSFLYEFRKVLLTNNIEKAIRESFGYDLDTFNRRFNKYLRQKYFPILMEKKSPDDYGTEIGVRKPGVYTFSPTISPSGELVAGLTTPKMELDLLVLSAEDGSKIKNLTKGWTNSYQYLVTEVFSGRRDLSWSPVADQVAVFARRENRWPLLVFNALKGKKIEDINLKDIVQCSSPAFSPDGKRIAFEGNRNGVVDIFEVDIETKEVRNITQDDFYDANPWYAPDGKTLLYNRRIGSYWKIFSVDLSDSERKTQITTGPSSDIQPSFSRDGQTIFFSSNRGPDGVFNIFAFDLASGNIEQYTDVVGGCFSPVEMAERNDDRHLVFTAYYSGTFRLYRMALREPESKIDVEELLAETIEAEPFEPALSLRLDEDKKVPYKLKWDIDSPYLTVGVADDGTFLANAAIGFSDLLGDHRINLALTTVDTFASITAQYVNLKHRYNWGGAVFDYRDFFLTASNSGLSSDQGSSTTGVSAFIQYPLSRNYRVDTTLSLYENSQDLLVGTDGLGFPVFEKFTDRFVSLYASLTGDTTRYQSFGAFQGKRFQLSAQYAPHISGDFEGDFIEYRLDYRAYRQVTRRSLFALRLAGIYNDGEREAIYGLGGLNQLRGWDFREFIGSRQSWLNLEYRFPLIDQLSFPILNLFQIRGFFYFDVGAAWLLEDAWYDPTTNAIRLDLDLGSPDFGQPIPFELWDSDSNTFQDGRASYGAGFQFLFLGGLQLNWVWTRRMDYMEYQLIDPLAMPFPTFGFVKVDGGDTRQEFYIVFDY